MIKHIIVITMTYCFAIAAVSPLYAQLEQENTLGSLWPTVERNYPGVGVKISEIEAAKLHERAVKSEMLPQVKAQAQHTYGTYEGSAGAFFPQPGFFNVSGQTNALTGSAMAANSFGSTTVEWELFSFGRLRKESDAATTRFRKTVSEKDAYLLNLKKTVSERYIAVLYNDAKLTWTEKNVERLNTIRAITSGLSAAGLRPAADSLLASASYVQALGEREKWLGYRAASAIKFSELYGDDAIDYTTSAIRFSRPVVNQPNGVNTVNPSHPILDALDMQSRYNTLSGEAQKRSALPSFRVLGGYAYRGTGINSNGYVAGAWNAGFNNPTSNMLVGIGITWNMTNRYTNRLKGEELFKKARSAKLLHSQYEQAMQADIAASRAKIQQQYEQLGKTGLAVKQSQDAYDMYLARYKSGLITLSELLQIRTLLEQAENVHIEVSRDYWMLLAYEAELTADFNFLFNNL